MAKNSQKPTVNRYEERQRRRQKILFGVLAAIIIISWVLTLVIQV